MSQTPSSGPVRQVAPRIAVGALFVVIFYTIGYFLSNFYRAANAVISDDLIRDVGLSAANLGLMTSLFYVGFAAVQLPLGAALDRFGPRYTVPAFMSLSVIGSLIFSVAESFPIVALGRTLIGIGMAGGLMGMLKAFGLWFDPQRYATISGIAVGVGAAGALIAATPLAWANATIGWRSVFVVAGVITAISAALIALGTRNAPKGVDWQISRQTKSAGFGQIFRDRRFWHIAPMNFFLLGTLLSIQTLWGGPYLFDVLGLDQVAVGNLLLAMSGGVTVGYMSGGWISDRFGLSRVANVGMGLFILSQLLFIIPSFTPPAELLGISYFIFGFTGSFNLLLLVQVRTLFPPEISGRANTALNLFGFSGTAIIQGTMGLIISQFPRGVDERYGQEAYFSAFGFAFIGCVLAFIWYTRRPKEV